MQVESGIEKASRCSSSRCPTLNISFRAYPCFSLAEHCGCCAAIVASSPARVDGATCSRAPPWTPESLHSERQREHEEMGKTADMLIDAAECWSSQDASHVDASRQKCGVLAKVLATVLYPWRTRQELHSLFRKICVCMFLYGPYKLVSPSPPSKATDVGREAMKRWRPRSVIRWHEWRLGKPLA